MPHRDEEPAETSSLQSSDSDILWGAGAIGACIGLPRHAAHRALKRGYIPGAKMIGGRWAASRTKLLEMF